MAASTLAGAITFTGCAVMPSVTAFADTTEQTGQVSYDNEVMPIHTDVQTEAKPLMKGTSCTVSDGKNLYYAFEMMGVRMGIMKYNTKTGKKSEVYSYKIGKNKKGIYLCNLGPLLWNRCNKRIYLPDRKRREIRKETCART